MSDPGMLHIDTMRVGTPELRVDDIGSGPSATPRERSTPAHPASRITQGAFVPLADGRAASSRLLLRHHACLSNDSGVARPVPPDLDIVRRALDAVSDGVVVTTDTGAIGYRNAAAVRLLDDAEPPVVRAIRLAATDALSGGMAHVREAESGGRRFELRAMAFVAADGTAGALVVITCVSPPVPAADVIARRHGLSRREAAVAALLAQGASNDAIVRRLGISVSTARHYTERVLVKLGAHSRGEAAALILGAASATTRRARTSSPVDAAGR
jgi:DNA-binding CsgD family transcriptional regulator